MATIGLIESLMSAGVFFHHEWKAVTVARADVTFCPGEPEKLQIAPEEVGTDRRGEAQHYGPSGPRLGSIFVLQQGENYCKADAKHRKAHQEEWRLHECKGPAAPFASSGNFAEFSM